MRKLIRILAGMAFAELVIGVSPVAAEPYFSITYYDNYNYTTGLWETWDIGLTETKYWNDEYLVDLTSGKTNATSHYLSSIYEFDLRGGFTSLDVPPHPSGDEDWNPLESTGDSVTWNLRTITDALGNVSTYAYDAAGNKISETDPLGNTTTYSYDASGNLLTITDPLGNVSTNTYDAAGSSTP
jgi:YD repeat-containing protein